MPWGANWFRYLLDSWAVNGDLVCQSGGFLGTNLLKTLGLKGNYTQGSAYTCGDSATWLILNGQRTQTVTRTAGTFAWNLMVSNGTVAVLATNLSATAKVVINPGATVDCSPDGGVNSCWINVGSDFTNNGTFLGRGGTNVFAAAFYNNGAYTASTFLTTFFGANNCISNGGVVFGNVEFNVTANHDKFLIDNMRINGNVQVLGSRISAGWNSGVIGTSTVYLAGNYYQTNQFGYTVGQYGRLKIVLNGTNEQTIGRGIDYFQVDLTVTNGANARLWTPFWVYSRTAYVAPGGTLNLNGQAFTATTFNVSGTLRLRGNETVAPVPALNAGSTVQYDGIDGTPVTVKTNWSYKTLTLAGVTNREFQFIAAAGATTTVTEAFNTLGTRKQTVRLRSTADGNTWHINASAATKSVQGVDVKDSTSEPGTAWIEAFDSYDSGNNVRWFIHEPPAGSIMLVR
jgi:hypothetical protein